MSTTDGSRWERLRRPPVHWFALAVLLVTLALMLTLDAAVAGGGEEAPPRGPGAVADDPPAGQVLDLSGHRIRSQAPDDDAIAIAVAGLPPGPALRDALQVLEAAGAGATWFVSGVDAADRSGDVGSLRTAGMELGVTGFDGDLRGSAPWRVRLALSLAQAALAGRNGLSTSLLLLPATPTMATVDEEALDVGAEASNRGYLLVAGTASADLEPGDIAVLDGTGDLPAQLRATLARAERLGVDVRSVSAVAGLRPGSVTREVGLAGRVNGRSVLTVVAMAGGLVAVLQALTLPLVILVVGRVVLTGLAALVHARRRRAEPQAPWTGTVSVVVPAFNERAGIEASLRSLVASDRDQPLEIVVVDDGSTDGTADLVAALGLPGVTVLRQENAGKPAALNTGVAASSGDVVVLLDGDTVFQPDTIGELLVPFADERVGAVSGNAKVLNRTGVLGRFQHLEYVMGFNLDRRFLDVAGAITTIPGAVGAFRRQALDEVGGVSEDTIAEDTDVTIAVARAGWQIVYRDSAIAWTEAPSRLVDLWRQRYRWAYGTLQAIWKQRRAVLEHGTVGLIGLPYALVFQVMLALAGPVLDVAALHALFTGSEAVLRAWVIFTVGQMLLAAFALRLDRESVRPVWIVPFQQLVYRQLMYLVVIQSVVSAASGARLRWHKLHRVGIPVPDAA